LQTVDEYKLRAANGLVFDMGKYQLEVAVLIAALAHAAWNALAKASSSKQAAFFGLNLTVAVIGALALPITGLPGEKALPYLLIALFIHTAYNISLARAYETGELGQTYPISRGLAPLIVAGGAALLAGEHLSVPSIIAISLVSGGIIALANVKKADRDSIFYALVTGVTIAGYSLTDGLGVRAASNPYSYAASVFAGSGTLIATILAVKLGKSQAKLTASSIGTGILDYFAYSIVLYAQRQLPLATVSALRETSVAMAAIIGWTFLGERSSWIKIGAVAAVLAGTIVLSFAGLGH
jgi:drug/metabolite transporter (DMT)-like permease